MKGIWISAVVGAVFLAAGISLFVASENRNIQIFPPTPRHPVTEEMRASAEATANRRPENRTLEDTEGRPTTLSQIQKGRPMFVYFIKDGCPCSVDSEPMFQKLYAHLNEGRPDSIPFVGVIGSPPKIGKDWVRKFTPPYPVLCAPDHVIMAAYRSPRSVYSLLLAADGSVIKQWPGWSKSILLDINQEASKALGVQARSFDTAYAPLEDSAGCSFDPKIAAIEDDQTQD